LKTENASGFFRRIFSFFNSGISGQEPDFFQKHSDNSDQLQAGLLRSVFDGPRLPDTPPITLTLKFVFSLSVGEFEGLFNYHS
jgi:hypothetical protein